jgi:benzoate-CoA ligase family protein
MAGILTAAALGVPETFNAAAYFVDRHLNEGRADRVAIECGEERVTYRQLHDGVNRAAAAMRRDWEVRPEERVVLLLLDTPAFACAFFGAIKIGAVPVPVNTLWKAADYRYVLEDSGARVLIVSRALLPEIERIDRADIPALRHIVVSGGNGDDRYPVFDGLAGSEEPPASAAAPTHRDQPAFWLYSSGSTGKPKGCVHLQHDMVICAELFAKGVLGLREEDRSFSVAKLFFAYGLGNALYFPLAVGGTAILSPGPPTAANVYATIEQHRPTLLYSVPTGYGMLLAQEGHFDLSSVRLAVSAGEALPPALFDRFRQRFGIDILDGIGSTEALHMFIANRPGAIRPGSSGVIVPGYEARVLDENGAAVSTGEIGNLWVSGDSVCAGYWNQPEKTQQTIEGRWLRTGDKYLCDGDGYFWYQGRSDDMLKVGGLWVSPVEVENALIEHPAVRECGVVGVEDRDRLVKPAAFVVLRDGFAAGPELATELQNCVRGKLADYKRPRWIRFLPELPKTATGKIQRFKLRDAYNFNPPIR